MVNMYIYVHMYIVPIAIQMKYLNYHIYNALLFKNQYSPYFEEFKNKNYIWPHPISSYVHTYVCRNHNYNMKIFEIVDIIQQ